MTREITGTEHTKQYASEPVTILEIYWAAGRHTFYATKTLGTGIGGSQANSIGAIVGIENFSEQIKVGNSGIINNISVEITGLRGRYDTNILLGRRCIIHQAFVVNGVYSSDGATMFEGKIASPISWNEATDTLKFDVVSQITDSEYGFSLEESGSYGYIPDDDAYNVAWPIVFGKCLNVPSLKIQSGINGVITEPLLRSSTIIEVKNGDKFTQTPTELRLLIGQLIVTGEFDGTQLTLNSINEPRYTSLATAAVPGGDDDVDNFTVIWIDSNVEVKGSYLYSSVLEQSNYCYRQETVGGTTKVWCSGKWGSSSEGIWTDSRPTTITEVAGAPRDSWFAPPMQFLFSYIIPTDTSVYRINTNGTIHTDSQVIYVASLTADSVLDVKAYRTIDKERVLCNVPSSYYTKATEDVGAGFDSLTITMDLLLSSRDKEGWDDDLFVSINSTLSSNTSTLIKYLLDTYSEYTTDVSSFSAVATQLINFPSNFALFSQGDVLRICEEIAWQARCALKVVNDIVYIKYLSTEPSNEATIDDDDFEIKTTQLSLTDETEIVTKFSGQWKKSYSLEDKTQTYVVRENIDVYGLIKQTFDFYIFNVKSLVEKSVNFWAHRYANVWKLVSFDSFMNNMNLEAMDGVTLETTLHNIVTPDSVITVVQNVSIESATGKIRLDLWLPVNAGDQEDDPDAWMTDDESLIDIDISGLREYDYEVELEEAEDASRQSIQTIENSPASIPRTIEGWTLIATTLENAPDRGYINCSIMTIDATPWNTNRVPDYIIGEPVTHGGYLYVSKTTHTPSGGNQPTIGGNTNWYDLDAVEVEHSQPNPTLTMKDMEPALVLGMNINVSFTDGIWILNGQTHPETLMGRTMQFKCTQDAQALTYIAAKLTQFDHAPAWQTATYTRRHQFVVHSSRLFECLVPHDSEETYSIPITGSVWSYYWLEWTTDNIYFEIKGATNLDDLTNPLVTDDLITAKYDRYDDQWNAVDTLYEGGGSGATIQMAKITQILEHAGEDEYEVRRIDENGGFIDDIGSPLVIDRALGYEGYGSDGTDLRNFKPWFGIDSVVPVSQHYDDVAAELKWFITLPMDFIGKPEDRSLDIEVETTADESEFRIMAVWK